MRKFRFHIGSFVILILLFAVCLAALREANEIWDSSVSTLTLTGGPSETHLPRETRRSNSAPGWRSFSVPYLTRQDQGKAAARAAFV
jgi:hypothetical protein